MYKLNRLIYLLFFAIILSTSCGDVDLPEDTIYEQLRLLKGTWTCEESPDEILIGLKVRFFYEEDEDKDNTGYVTFVPETAEGFLFVDDRKWVDVDVKSDGSELRFENENLDFDLDREIATGIVNNSVFTITLDRGTEIWRK